MRSSKMAARVSACFSPRLLLSLLLSIFSPFQPPPLSLFLSFPTHSPLWLCCHLQFASSLAFNLPKTGSCRRHCNFNFNFNYNLKQLQLLPQSVPLPLPLPRPLPLLQVQVQVTQLALFARAQFHALLSLIVYPWDYGNITMPRATVGDVGRRRLPYPLCPSTFPFTPSRDTVIGCEMLAKLATAGGAKGRARGSSRGEWREGKQWRGRGE